MKMMLEDDLELIPSVEATPEEKAAFEALMRKSNRVLKIYFLRAKQKMSRNYSLSQFCCDLWRAVKLAGPTGPVVVVEEVVYENDKGVTCRKPGKELVGIPRTDLAMIQELKNVEYNILCVYARFIFKRAKLWSSRNHHTQLSFSDFYNEATAGALKAIYYFDKEDTQFMTYLYWCIDRTVQTAINKNKPLSHWLTENVKLYGEFEKTRHKLGLEVTFDEVVSMMELDEESITDLRNMLCHVVNHSQIRPANAEGEHEEGYGIYLAISKDTLPTEDSSNIMEIADKTVMTDWERIVLNAYLKGTRGWATEVAESNINPDTGREYSRRAPKIALDRVLARIRQNFETKLGNCHADAA